MKLAKDDPAVRYEHHPERLILGDKRNRLLEAVTGEIVVQFDDDDFYAPHYLETMVNALGADDFVTLSGWYVYSTSNRFFGYWDTATVASHHFKVSSEGVKVLSGHLFDNPASIDANLWGFGFSYAFRKAVYPAVRFGDVDFGEDYDFVKRLKQHGFRMKTVPDTSGLVLHMIHGNNMSCAFPQYRLPLFQLPQVFGEAIRGYEHVPTEPAVR